MSIPELPDLPDLEELKAAAMERREHFARVVTDAQAEVAKADAYLAALTGRKRSRKQTKVRRATIEKYDQVLADLANRTYACVDTLARAVGCSGSTVNLALQDAVARGHVTVEKRGRRNRFTITDAGLEYVTGDQGRVSMEHPLRGLDDQSLSAVS